MSVQLDNVFKDSDFEDFLNCFQNRKKNKQTNSKTTDIYKENIKGLTLPSHIRN